MKRKASTNPLNSYYARFLFADIDITEMLHTLHNCDCTNKLPHTVAVEESKHFACVEEKSECTFGISMPSLVLISINSTDFFSNCSLIFYEKPLIWHYINKTELN